MTGYEKVYADFFYNFLNTLKIYKKEYTFPIIFLCIGTSKIVGDSFGPLVGDKLKKIVNSKNIVVIGDLDENVSALNIKQKIRKIKEEYNDSLIISVDAALSESEEIGKIIISSKGIKIRKALQKQENSIGHLGIKAIVANNYKESIYNYFELIKTPFSRVDHLSEITANVINLVIKECNV